MGPSDSQQDMTGVQGAGGTGGTGGGTDAPVVQQQEQALPLDALKTEVDIAGQPVHRVPVEGGIGYLRQPCNQPVPQGRHLRGILIHVSTGLLQGCCHAHNGRDVLCPCPLAPLLGPALNEAGQRYPLPGV